MQLHFNAISEPGMPGPKWRKLFNTHWPAYKVWFDSKGVSLVPDLKTSQAELKKHMPEMWPVYKKLCKLVNADEAAARFLTGYQPPAYISACSQAVITGEEIQLVRNYDYHPDLSEGTQLLTAWHGKKVIASSDCLIGAVDGMNEDGLAISLTFGGRKAVGKGFGIPFILRYVLEFCSNVEEAVAALVRIPSHMSYNVTVVDKSGTYKTVRLAPDKSPVITDARFVTNHQETVDWPENAAFNKTIERSAFLEILLNKKGTDGAQVTDAFLRPPLYNTQFKEGFGTLYTAVYLPLEGLVELRWPEVRLKQTFADFKETYKLIDITQAASEREINNPGVAEPEINQADNLNMDWQKLVSQTLTHAMAQANPSAEKEQLDKLRVNLIKRGEVSWEVLADFWLNTGKKYWENRKN